MSSVGSINHTLAVSGQELIVTNNAGAAARAGGSEGRETLVLSDLMERNRPWLEASLRLKVGALVRARESFSDLAQSVCRELLQDVENVSFRSETAFRTFMLQVAERKIIEKHRYYTRHKRDVGRTVALDTTRALGVPGRGASPSEAAGIREVMGQLEACFDELPADYREIIVLFHIVGMPHRQIAEHLGRSEAAARNLLSRALARLARIMRRHEQGA